jgi:hypothetical protein
MMKLKKKSITQNDSKKKIAIEKIKDQIWKNK